MYSKEHYLAPAGKSTVAVNLAIALRASGPDVRVALLDADVYGPSVPRMMGLERSRSSQQTPTPSPSAHGAPSVFEAADDRAEAEAEAGTERPLRPAVAVDAQQRLKPLEAYGVRCMSMGLLVSEARGAIVWRGPMVMSAIQRLLFGVDWGTCNYMVIDLPPGTGKRRFSIHLDLNFSSSCYFQWLSCRVRVELQFVRRRRASVDRAARAAGGRRAGEHSSGGGAAGRAKGGGHVREAAGAVAGRRTEHVCVRVRALRPPRAALRHWWRCATRLSAPHRGLSALSIQSLLDCTHIHTTNCIRRIFTRIWLPKLYDFILLFTL